MIPDEVASWFQDNVGESVLKEIPVSGGCINNGIRLELGSGATYFLKSNSNAPKDMFQREYEGLEILLDGKGPIFPKPLVFGPDFLLTEDLAPAKKKSDWGETLGRELAKMHDRNSAKFGFENDNYIGSTVQLNDWTQNGHEFFAEKRLIFQTRLARDNDFLSKSEASLIDQLANRLPDLIPVQSACLIHGDLWAGNAISDRHGNPALIDPAVHYGWAEAEIAMTRLFGGFGEEFYRTYEESGSFQKDWRDRSPIYNLYHVLNHLNLFGGGYHDQAMGFARMYS